MQNSQYIYDQLYALYTDMNKEFFDAKLPHVVLTVSTGERNVIATAHSDRFIDTEKKSYRSINFNADWFKRSLKSTASTMLHEMIHIEQYEEDTAGRAGYHNKDFAKRMELRGLVASDTGAEGGKKTGQHMDHYIVEEGHFNRWFDSNLSDGDNFKFIGKLFLELEDEKEDKPKKPKSKVKYTCPICDAKAWAKPNSKLICGEDMSAMEAEEAEEDEAADNDDE